MSSSIYINEEIAFAQALETRNDNCKEEIIEMLCTKKLW